MSGLFRFKQFSLSDEASSMKIGTDAVLLGAWTECKYASQILDVGSGCGILSLMLAQRSQAKVFAIEIDPGAAGQCHENFQNSPWPDRLELQKISVQEFCQQNELQFDLIVCNPPFFQNSLLSPDQGRNLARHNNTLGTHDLLLAVNFLGNDDISFNLILPSFQETGFVNLAKTYGLNCTRKLNVRTFDNSPFVRVLMEFQRKALPMEVSEMVLRDSYGQYTQEYQRMTFEYHLGF
ncbi:MAG: methyltransferase [Bacteroidota bacterium]